MPVCVTILTVKIWHILSTVNFLPSLPGSGSGSCEEPEFRPSGFCPLSIVAKFIVSDWGGMKSTLAQGCRTGPPAYIRAEVNYILQSRTLNLDTGFGFYGMQVLLSVADLDSSYPDLNHCRPKLTKNFKIKFKIFGTVPYR